ncbi:aminotransferase class I/II-fold pyridoxal phosphate-dependent enzyme [Nocardia macrotermitis]|uniref:Putative phenylalanine aminotransferase n=1 Tax=Nocardia macrotermitis TaxID=2585198 RepID=A0A7K0DE91_9NOCA|nr:aminotransferase class I/II-fold pyridoxal phosphate-dependent enzyme [Nocardia macrotermitis]MQY23602.1 putative phenylalanine aminotransferase [Nocardia macrotermitis]
MTRSIETDVHSGSPTVRARSLVAALPRYTRAAGLNDVRWRASSNESTVPPSPHILTAIREAAAHGNLYPSLIGEDLISDISARLAIDPARIVVGGGSIALLQNVLAAYTGHGSKVVHAWRSYEAYPILIGVVGATAVPVPLDADFAHDPTAMLAAIDDDTRAIILCNPNNPTGTELSPQQLERLIAGVPGHVLVILDEAYQEFSRCPSNTASLREKFPNLVVLRTFSKAYGLAGLRAGYLLAHPDIADDVRAASPPFGLSRVAEAAARAAWADRAHTDHIVEVVREGRAYLVDGLSRRGIHVPRSGANFVWLPVGARTAELEAACVARGVSVRAFDGEGVRVTVGERAAHDAVLAAIDDLAATSRNAGPTA